LMLAAISGCQTEKKKTAPMAESETISKYTIDKINPRGGNFPGGRDADEMILYTPKYGGATGTNEWGIEAVIQAGVARTVGGNNSAIPSDGFVLSGHGRAADWLGRHIYPGVLVSVNKRQIAATDNADAQIYFSNEIIKQGDEIFRQYPSDINPAAYKNKASDFIASKNSVAALNNAYEYLYRVQPSRAKEIRACWYRLHEKSPEELHDTIKKIADVGFNCICPETIYWGGAIYPNAHPFLPQHQTFLGWDPLMELCKLGKQYKIQIIPWVEVYFIGFQDSFLVAEKKQWLAHARHGSPASRLEEGYYYFCPSRLEVRDFWLEIYERLLKTYPIDGLQLDYIRYPRSLPAEEGYCYCNVCRKNFQERFGSDPKTLNPLGDKEQWLKWDEYRREQITIFVEQVRQLQKKIRPEIKLSADVFPVLSESKEHKFQDWELWLNKGWLDQVYFMAYTTDNNMLRKQGAALLPQIPEHVQTIVGLGPYLGFRPEMLLEQIRITRELGATGVCLFSLEYLSPEDFKALKMGTFRLIPEQP